MARLKLAMYFCPLFLVVGCANEDPKQELRLRISAVGVVRRDHLVVRVTAANVSNHAVVCDRELSAYMSWNITGSVVSTIFPEKLAALEKPRASEFNDRFMTLQSGDVLSHDFELTYLVRTCSSGHGTSSGPNRIHTGVFSESVRRFRIPQEERRVTVSIGLSRDTLASGAFHRFFGHWEDELAPWPRNTVSNQLDISLP